MPKAMELKTWNQMMQNTKEENGRITYHCVISEITEERLMDITNISNFRLKQAVLMLIGACTYN